MDRKRGREDAGNIRQIASLCSPHPCGGLTELVLMHRQVARFKEMGVSACMCVCVCMCMCVWSNMVQLLQANCLALESEAVGVHECV